MKIMSWNINGFESTLRKGQLEPLIELSPDIICLQEIKCSSDNLLKQFAEKYHFNYIYSLAQKRVIVVLPFLLKSSVNCIQRAVGILEWMQMVDILD